MKHILLLVAASVLGIVSLRAQALDRPFPFTFPDGAELDTGLVGVPFEKAGARGRVVLTQDGHLGFADGTRLRLAGTGMQWSGMWPDSARAIELARRFRSLGINCVRFSTFDVSWWSGGSILADGPTTLGNGLNPAQMKKFDWFLHQLRENGVYYVFTFHSVWQPRAEDGVRQPDSLGWGARMPLIFDARVQQIHRGIMRLLLEHVNPHTGLAYKDDPALAYVIAAEDASLMAFWLYSGDVVRPNSTFNQNTGTQHIALIDSLWHAWLRGKGYTTDAALNSAWSAPARSTENLVRNGGFEDPFSATWQVSFNSEGGGQALLQFSDAEKKEGATSGRVRIGSLDASKLSYSLFLYQRLASLRRLGRYEVSFWAKTTPQRGSRTMQVYVYNGTFPFDWYGFDQTLTTTSEWQRFTYTFTARSSDSLTANLAFFLGADSGDVFLDDVQVREVSTPGLIAGESIQSNRVPRSLINNTSISPARSRDNALFYHERLSAMYSTIRRFVRDTVKSSVLLCPSGRMLSFWELSAAPDYDVYTASDWRNTTASMLTETYGGTVYAAAQLRPKGKAFVIGPVSIAHPRPYATDLTTIFPAYAGLQDWDGVFFSTWSDNVRTGADKIDSNSYWHIADKPGILSMLPVATSMIRSGAVSPSVKEIVIDNTREDIEQPRFHVTNAFSLSINSDARMPLFRRVSMNATAAQTESFLPHREISALSDQVDVSALDSETEQIFWNASDATFRVETPRYVLLSGGGSGNIVSMQSLIVEQTTSGAPPAIGIASLTDMPITESPRSLLVVGARAQNTGLVFDQAAGTFTTWGTAPLLMEGIGMRFTITAPLFDTLRVVPLGHDGLPKRQPIIVDRRAGGRFSFALATGDAATPWYRLEFVRNTTSVAEDGEPAPIDVAPNPVTGPSVSLGVPDGTTTVTIRDVTGAVVGTSTVDHGTIALISTSHLSSGTYVVHAYKGSALVGVSTFSVLR